MMNKGAVMLAASLTASLTLMGCETTRQDMGAVIGGVAGGLLGSQIGGGQGRTLAILGGVAAGALVGRELGRYLDEREQRQLAEATHNTARTGSSSTWSNPQTGASGSTRVVNSRSTTDSVQVPVLKERVETIPPLELIGEDYAATSAVNVRGGPGTDYKRVGSLSQGEVIMVQGKVKGSDWYMISQGGVATGFVHGSFLAPATSTQMAAAKGNVRPQGTVETANIQAESTCRTIEQVVILPDGAERTDTVTACQTPNGWEYQQS
ncbi:SH3 domain-containing protein [Zobellella sp. An-6]|uniref:SH3 domain-containing protein n=1 Tax=Zobellella sp. An-6 TaxID=3400218 RepID=UPI0040414E48